MDDDYDSVFPVPSYVRFGVQYAATPAFIQQLGAFSPDKSASNSIVEFLDFMPDIYKLTDLCISQQIEYHGYKVTEKSNFELRLSSHYEKLWERYTPECRKFISGAAKKRFELTEDVSPEELVDMCIENKRSNIGGVRLRDYDRLINLMHHCITGSIGRIVAVRAAKKRVDYGMFLVQLPGSITIILEANTTRSIEKHIGYFVINEIIRDNASTGTILDFAGISDRPAIPFGSLIRWNQYSILQNLPQQALLACQDNEIIIFRFSDDSPDELIEIITKFLANFLIESNKMYLRRM